MFMLNAGATTPIDVESLSWDVKCDEVVESDRSVATTLIPLRQDDGASYDSLQDFVTKAAKNLQMHQHTFTCKKGGREGGHLDCRMGYDRPLVPASGWLENGCVLLQRNLGNIVSFIPSLMLALPFNHHMSLTLDASRYARSVLLWKDAVAQSKSQVRTMQKHEELA